MQGGCIIILKMITQVTSRSHRMSVEFHSDRRVTGTGFLAKWKKVKSNMLNC